MTVARAARLTADLIEDVIGIARTKLKGEAATQAEWFIRRFYAHVPPADIVETGAETLYGAALALWRFGAERRPGQAKVRVYNPRLAEDGWSSPHTIVEIVNDDMPFLVDSVTAELNRRGLTLHLVIHPILRAPRGADGRLLAAAASEAGESEGLQESFMHVEIDEVIDPARLDAIVAGLTRVLADVRAAVADWPAMRAQVADVIGSLTSDPPPVPTEELAEPADFLRWLDDNNFTFLGYREYVFEGTGEALRAHALPETSLGVLRPDRAAEAGAPAGLEALPGEVLVWLKQPTLLDISKAGARATVHRPVHMDYVGVKRFDAAGNVTGIRRFLGLLTSVAYNTSPRRIPVLRRKVARVLERADLAPNSHDEKALIHILETLPPDELFQIDEDSLYATATGILHLQERQRIALFARQDPFQRYVSCLVFVPRDVYTTELRHRFVRILEDAFGGVVSTFSTQLGDEPLARVHFIVRTTPGDLPDYDVKEIEQRLAEAGRSWRDRLQQALVARFGEAAGLARFRRFGEGFPVGYRERFGPETAMADIALLEEALATGRLAMNLYRPVEAAPDQLRFKLYRAGAPMPLSDVLPMLEHMGLRVIGEMPYELAPEDGPAWIHDFDLTLSGGGTADLRAVRGKFQEAFARLWTGDIENDGLNRLVLRAGLDWRQIVILRAFARYLRQLAIPFSQAYMEETLARHADVTARIVALFEARFDPQHHDEGRAAALRREIGEALEQVQVLDEDRILRRFLNLAEAALRTNHYQTGPEGRPKPYLAVKYDSAHVEEMPLPRPMFEIFVYSPRVEAIHMRGGKVARGGIRWSDRREDFRTEILGLLKAQMVKNAVIVPVGAKGGFVVKRPPADASREAQQAEGVECYKILIRGMLDLTDNLDGATVVPPENVVRHDGDDPYIVAAADKGTATFSDIANGLAADYGYWLRDAFASGGSAGYDHKGMGITARGAWESVKRHFRELGVDVQAQDFTVVGVGDMSGDVFGNGMLQSKHIRLLGAFDHRHVFIDPDPDAEASWAERKRLFDLPRSSWADYDPALISKGGGVFPRTAKSIPVSPEMKARFAIEADAMTPNELIRALLRAPVDLLYLGGIGTYVKGSEESNAEVGDRANDANRVDGGEVRARVVGEGANLGWTQRGRIEYALKGGRINTDFIDNSGGVDTSDHEVNIKILLNKAIDDGELTRKQRDALLADMTGEVARLVLRHNYLQGQAISLTQAEAAARLGEHVQLIRNLERSGRLNRAVEFLPDDETIARREAEGLGLTRPEIAVLLSYAKIALNQELLASDFPDDPRLLEELLLYFPQQLRERWRDQIARHRLRREIIATFVTNSIVDRGGITFVDALKDRTGRTAADVARAFSITVAAFGLRDLWHGIEALDGRVDAALQIRMLLEARRLITRGSLWFLRYGAAGLDVASYLESFRPGIERYCAHLAAEQPEEATGARAARRAELETQGVDPDLARAVAGLDALASAPDVVRIAASAGAAVEDVARLYFAVGERFRLDWLRAAAEHLRATTGWQRLAIETFVDDLYGHQAQLAARVLAGAPPAGAPIDSRAAARAAVDAWAAAHGAAATRLDHLLDEIRSAGELELAMLVAVNGQLRTLTAGE